MVFRPEFKPGEFPDLPEILSPEIKLKVFTHRSFYARSAHVFEDHPDDPSPDNEKYSMTSARLISYLTQNFLF